MMIALTRDRATNQTAEVRLGITNMDDVIHLGGIPD
ncbi:MAG: hypothetical protein JWM91_948 [Rhodospirillales bacterium]|nr:hypothetical protein [Rhodospirillales bacterium]